MWNDTDIPLAHLITFRCYETWLHGDERGSVDRFHNQYQSSYIQSNLKWQKFNVEKLKGDAVMLNTAQREAVEAAVRRSLQPPKLAFASSECADKSRSHGRFNRRCKIRERAERIQILRNEKNARAQFVAAGKQPLG